MTTKTPPPQNVSQEGGEKMHADRLTKFIPVHERTFPARLKNENGKPGSGPPLARKDFPATGTPDAVLHSDLTAVTMERSAHVTEAGHAVPVSTEWTGIEREQDDWLDRDAASSK